MATRLNNRGYRHAQDLVKEGRVVLDDRDAWSEHQPRAADENRFIQEHGIGEFGRWFLGVDDEQDPNKKGHYKYPYGDFDKVHRCGVITAEARAAQQDHRDVERAAAHLHGMLEVLRAKA